MESEYNHKLDFFTSKLLQRGYEKSEDLRRTQNLGERLVRAKITSDTNLEPLPYDLLAGDASSEIDSHQMSQTLRDLLDLLNDN